MMTAPSKTPPITCSDLNCLAEWTALGAAHCGACHRTFASAGLFDEHRMATRDTTDLGRCLDPATVRHNGRRIMFYREGMWRGPEMSAEAKVRMGRLR